MPSGYNLHLYDKTLQLQPQGSQSGEYAPHLTHAHDELVFLLKTRQRLLETFANTGHLLGTRREGWRNLDTKCRRSRAHSQNKLAAESLTADMYRYFVLEEATQQCQAIPERSRDGRHAPTPLLGVKGKKKKTLRLRQILKRKYTAHARSSKHELPRTPTMPQQHLVAHHNLQPQGTESLKHSHHFCKM